MTRPPKDFPQQKYVSAENTIRGTRTRGRATSFTENRGSRERFPVLLRSETFVLLKWGLLFSRLSFSVFPSYRELDSTC